MEDYDYMELAPECVAFYMKRAIELIDGQLGAGYAKRHPALLGSFIQACAADYAAGIRQKTAEHVTVARAGSER